MSTTMPASLPKKEVAGLSFDVEMVAGMGFVALALDPIPETLAAGGVEKDEQVFEMLLGHLLLDGGPSFGVRDSVAGFDFQHHDACQLGNGGAGVSQLIVLS